MSTLYIDRKNVELRLDGKTIACYENNERTGTIPLTLLERIVLKGDVTLHANLLGKLGENGTGIVCLSGRKNEVSLMVPRPHHDAERRITQYHLSTNPAHCTAFAQQIIDMKISRQVNLLDEMRQRHPESRYKLTFCIRHLDNALLALRKQPDIPAIRGIEGNAAAHYFAGLAAILPERLHFSGRNRRPPKDPFNAAISLGYTLLFSKTVIALYSAGLDPFVGFYHALDFGRESLACDLVEPFRAEIDRFVLNLFSQETLRPEDFKVVDDACLMNKTARIAFYRQYEPFYDSIKGEIQKTIGDICHAIKTKSDLLFPQTKVVTRNICQGTEEFETTCQDFLKEAA